MGARTIGVSLLISLVTTMVLGESPPATDLGCGKPPLCPQNEVHRCQNTCPPDSCFTLYAAIDCIANQTCVDGCYCKADYLRIGRTGPCVPRDQCPPIECVNDPNARRGCGDTCRKTCADYNSNRICPERPCKNDGCDCKEGYIHDTNVEMCVLPKDCTKACQPHERWSPCLMGECVAKTCEDLGKPLACPAVAMDPCPGGCICDYGYVRAKDGTCVDAKTCPSCGGDPNAQTGCGNPCGKTCDSGNTNKSEIICPQYCEDNGCDCKEGYLLDTDAKPPRCVLVKDCPIKCKKNEEYYCGPSCPDSEASCSNPNPPICINKRCEFKCFCKKGYVRDTKNGNVCIPVDTCPKKCKRNEIWTDCYLGACVPKTCDDLGKPLPCPDIAGPCAGGCICVDGFVRDKNGICIDAKKCPSCGGDPNAQAGCGNPCGRTCARLGTNSRRKRDTAATACATYCLANGCDCKEGYILNTGVKPPRCVLPEDCNKPVNCTKEHERYIDCLAGQCSPKSCDDLGKSIACPGPSRGPCPGGCICEQGYVRDAKGHCIKLEDCPPKPCGKNETWVTPCNQPCPNPRCPRDDKPPPPCVVLEPCYPGCQCKLNYLRNSTGNCILAPDCPSVNCTRQNEVWDGCPSACLAESCDDINNQPTTCNTLIWLCSPRCVCKKGYFRNKDGTCIPASQCPLYCKDPNASWVECRDICPGTCQNPKPICMSKIACRSGCQCKKGYVLDKTGESGKCVKIGSCPATTTTPAPPKCKANEHWIDCYAGQCQPKTCDDLITPPPCPRLIPPCPGGCICDDGYLRDATGTCIKKKDCPPKPCGNNETWVTPCNQPCPNPRCPRDDKPPPPCVVLEPCYPGCQCKLNYLRNSTGNCILAPDCPSVKCTRQNEVWDGCPSTCLAESCDDINNQPTTCNTLIWLCSPRCVCKKGYFRNKDGTCIPASQCPLYCKDPNASWIECRDICPGTCQNPKPICMSKMACRSGCQCKKGYVLDKTGEGGKCVKIGSCPATTPTTPAPPKCKANEHWIDCYAGQCQPKTCDDLITPPPCPRLITPCPGGCICDDGYLRDATGTCINKKDCPSLQCKKKNERWSNCLLGECVPKTCEDVGYPVACPDIIGPCAGGCTCIEGFVRDCSGSCIDMKKCPCCGGDPNAVSGCGNPCGKTCASLYSNSSDLICPEYCEYNGCDCKPGYRLLSDTTDEKKCVPEKECPKPQPSCKANETYVSCSVKCPNRYCSKFDGPQPVCDPPRNCPAGCICKINYRYDDSGNCILASECPPLNCTDPNAVWDSCPSACLNEECDAADSPPVICNTLLLNCNPRCVCKPGHYKHPDTGKCVPAKECPSVCKDPNASWKECRDSCPSTCQNTKPICINKFCSPGCQCNDGYVLSKQGEGGKCVKIETCADYADCPANQTFVSCTFRCPQVMCPDSDQTILCKPPRDCPGGCGCQEYYRYNADGNCIKSSECPPVECTRPNEEFVCQRMGDWENCDDRYNSPPIWEGNPDDCTPKCACKKGFWRDTAINKCVTEEECPPING